ncbi:UNVERIFIED_CONTAM: hypothetical protein Scaly_2277600 [Sesamum calycinum]|uniref:Uncharacterized protein n=1 Tax=Sesamum calycinum TaxID=2727403 RepID=A0AAW2MCZ9_9LAMI
MRNVIVVVTVRCAGANPCMLYLPTIDLWAIETCDKASEDGCESSSMEPQSPGKTSSGGRWEVDMEDGLYPSADVMATQTQTEVKVASYLWTSFIEQVESMRVNTSLIILATSELPFSLLPNRIRQFFGNEILNCSLSRPLKSKVPQFSVQLDAKFNHAKVITSFAAKLSKDFAQHFVLSLHGENHTHENSVEEKACYAVEGDADRVCHNKSCHVGLSSPVGFTNKTLKGKPNLLLAISTFGYQILCYPHFAELCWVTSKLKEGPSANTDGPWKGWPFNSCIVRPMNSTEKVASASSSSNIKTKESGIVRGLVAVGLSAYRGEYTSLREVCSEVRKVLETLVGRIDDKIQAGKDRSQFVRLLSQVAYLEDMVVSWAHALQRDVGCNPTEVDNGCEVAANEVAVTIEEPTHQVYSTDCCSPEHTLAPFEVKLESCKAEAVADHAEMGHVPVKLCNGFLESISDLQAGGPHGSGDKPVIELSSAAEISSPPNGPPLTDDNILSKDSSENSDPNILVINNASDPGSLKGGPAVTCFYQCCSECIVNLHNLLLRITNIEWGKKGTDSTVEDLHDFLSSLSANLILLLSKFLQCENPSAIIREGGNCKKYCECRDLGTDMPGCINADKLLIMECGCHETSKDTTSKENSPWISQGFDSRFVFKDGVLATLDTGTDVSYHCKFEKLCLCFLIEWLVTSKKSFD